LSGRDRWDQLVALGVANGADAQALDAWMTALAAAQPAPDELSSGAEALYDAGLAAVASGEAEEAAELFLGAAWMRPLFAEAWHNLGAAWMEAGREEDGRWAVQVALWLYERAIDADPEDPYAWYWAAACLVALGEQERALERLTEAVALAPEYAMEAAQEADFEAVRGLAGFRAILRLARGGG
jgi:tetratricopeptide (TPR) repeat protein